MASPVISAAQMRAWEALTWASGQTEAAVIARVGEVLAQTARRMTAPGESLLLLAGKGHNGDDVRAMVPHLHGREMHLLAVSNPLQALPELEARLAAKPALVVDGLFGIGLSRELDEHWQRFIAIVNGARVPVLAVDVPSGLDADTGDPRPVAVRARETVTVGAVKRGLLAARAAEWVGRISIAREVGLAACVEQSDLWWTEAVDFAGFPPERPLHGHKGTFGHVALFAGSVGFHGAAVLAARGAQRARPGLVTLFTQAETYVPVAAQLQAPMVHPWRDDLDIAPFTAWMAGPGLASNALPDTARQFVARLWRTGPFPVVVDASALAWLPPGATAVEGSRVITPHPGEAARLLGCSTDDVQRDRPAAVRALSRRFGGCLVVLKGRQTVVGSAEGRLFVNGSGNVGLAQGGSGDLLAGFIAGLLAQPALQGDPLHAVRFAVWEHGRAAERLSAQRHAWVIEEFASELGNGT